jgi:hypothetical protein
MKKFLVPVLFLVLSLHTLAQQTVTRSVGSFTGVKAAEGIDVYLKKGTKESVRVETDGIGPDRVVTEVSGNYLKIHMREGNRGKVEVRVYVEYVNIEKLSVSSAATLSSDGPILAKTLEISASSAGDMKIAVEAETVKVSASSAGEIRIKGKAMSVSADASSAGEVDAYELQAQSVVAEASSAGSVQVYVTESLTAQASSGGDVRYRGSPDKSITNSTSGGSVKKTN